MKKLILSLAVGLAAMAPAFGQDFFSTADADQLFNLGVRVGVNTSNRTISSNMASLWNHNSWGTGFTAGVVADLNIKNYISVQPGFFYESRSGAFAYQGYDHNAAGESYKLTQLGKGREYNFTIPIMASLHFNVLDELRWNIELGPYFQIKLKSTFDGAFYYPETTIAGTVEYFDNVKTARGDVGLKMGTSLDIYDHYHIGVHYLAGFCHPWNPGNLGGHNKEWLFTIGYNFF